MAKSACTICKKSIRNGASIKRHEIYCRKKLTSPAPPRQKACLACIHAKSRCDSCKPTCGQCQRKGRNCTYSSKSLFSREGQSVPSPSRPSPVQKSQYAPRSTQTAGLEVSQSTSSNPSIFDTYEASPSDVLPGLPTSESSELGESGFTEYVAATMITSKQSDMPATIEMPCRIPSRLLQSKQQQPAKIALVYKLVSQVLCSFPERKMTEASWPPFIHQSTLLRSTDAIHRDDPIIICLEIIRKFAVREDGENVSIWDAIASEQERIYDDCASFDKWPLLSSAQAMTMYLLMLTAEGESVLSHHPNLPITVLFTLGAIFSQLHLNHPGYVAAEAQSGGRPAWGDWIFAESKLRTAMIYFMLALLFNLDFGIPCRDFDTPLEDMELPAPKAFWEAKNELSWNAEFDLAVANQCKLDPVHKSQARLKYRDLLQHHKEYCGFENLDNQKDVLRLADRIKQWHKEMDELGMLVALCSTIV